MDNDILEQIAKLREQLDGSDSEESAKLSATETAVKRAMLVRDFGSHPAIQSLRATLQRRVELSDEIIITMAAGMPEAQDDIFRWALEMRQVTARKSCYQWFLKLFTVADQKIEVINNRLGKTKK